MRYWVLFLVLLLCISLLGIGMYITRDYKPVVVPVLVTPAITQEPVLHTSAEPEMSVYYIDVGQGDSELIVSPGGYTMLIDAGDASRGYDIAKVLSSRNISRIDYVIATHPHADHIGGMSTVIGKYTVGKFIDSGMPSTTAVYQNLLKSIEQKDIPFGIAKAGDYIAFDPAVNVSILNPGSILDQADPNRNSVVIKLVYRNVSFLFSGDADAYTEAKYGDIGHVDILKVGHHGSSTSTSQNLLNSIAPSICVISVGADNRYKHPAATTLSRLEQNHCEILRTDLEGTITFYTDGNYITSGYI